MKCTQAIRVAIFTAAAMLTASLASAHPGFSPESIGDFSAALATLKSAHLNMAHTWTLDARHSDPTRYRAYKFVIPDTVMIGIARSVTLDADGHVHIDPEPGAPMHGRANPTHREYSHILVPISVTPPA
ncbi:MAG TPA: hypothetical protein VHT53_04740 [Candidatus Elarobacter sp.]|jgi:hypothetical protein|nr:hypothetical protein [Candidatus Elarobacter sp.]